MSSSTTTLNDLQPTVLHAVNSTNSLAPEVDLDAEPEFGPRADACSFYTQDEKLQWHALDGKKSIGALGLTYGQVVGVSFPDAAGKLRVHDIHNTMLIYGVGNFAEPTVEPLEEDDL